jgi:hypothetical protein
MAHDPWPPSARRNGHIPDFPGTYKQRMYVVMTIQNDGSCDCSTIRIRGGAFEPEEAMQVADAAWELLFGEGKAPPKKECTITPDFEMPVTGYVYCGWFWPPKEQEKGREERVYPCPHVVGTRAVWIHQTEMT